MENYQKDTAIHRRKMNEWKYAAKRKKIYDLNFCSPSDNPLHYYSKNPPWNGYAFAPNKTNNKGSRRYISKTMLHKKLRCA